jgi:hypothetical protein
MNPAVRSGLSMRCSAPTAPGRVAPADAHHSKLLGRSADWSPSRSSLHPDIQRLSDRSAVPLEGGHLDVAARLELADNRSRSAHLRRHQSLRQGPLFSKRRELPCESAASLSLSDQARECRVAACALVDDLLKEVLHASIVHHPRHRVNAIAHKLRALVGLAWPQLPGRGPTSPPLREPSFSELDFFRGCLPRSLLEQRERQEHLAVAAFRREQEPKTASRCVGSHLVDVAAQVPGFAEASLSDLLHSATMAAASSSVRPARKSFTGRPPAAVR